MAKKTDKDQITCEIKDHIGYLNPDENKIFAKVSWNGNAAKYDIRKCYKKDGELRLLSGISLSGQEMEELVRLYEKHKSKEVNFDQIFSSATSIMEKRKSGFATKNGFIKLSKKR